MPQTSNSLLSPTNYGQTNHGQTVMHPSVHPLCAPLRPPLHAPPLRTPLRTPPSDWLSVPATSNHIPAFKNLINIKS